MKVNKLILVFSIALIPLFQSCKNSSKVLLRPTVNVSKMEDVLKGDNQTLIDLLQKVRGSVGKRGSGSKTIWSRKNDYELGLYISANHVYGVTNWTDRAAQFFDLNAENTGIFESSQIPQINGNIGLGNTLIADFPLMHCGITGNATNATVLPEEDFYLGVIDNQRIEKSPFSKYPDYLQKSEPLQMFDPSSRTKANNTWNTAIAGQMAMVVGYPNDTEGFPNGAVVYGKIFTESEAANIMIELKAIGDPEGVIPYNSNVEFFVDAQAISGMSGGGVFNADGQLLGIMVRATDNVKSPKIIRVVKMSYIKSKMASFYSGLSTTNKRKIEPFINGEL